MKFVIVCCLPNDTNTVGDFMPPNDHCFEGKGFCLRVLRCIADGTELRMWMIFTAESKKS